MTAPLVSFGVPVYNGADLLPRALDSILAQSAQDFEIVICDNASTDETADVAQKYVALDGRITYHRNDVNVGLVANFNRVFDLSRGAFFKWATHDDYVDPGFMEACLDALDGTPGSTLACTGTVVHDRDGHDIETWTPSPLLRSPRVAERAPELLRTMGETHPMFGIMRSSCLRRSGPFESYLAASRVLLFKLILEGSFATVSAPLYHYTEYRPADRVYSTYNDPSWNGRMQLRTWRALCEHSDAAVRAQARPREKAKVVATVWKRFAVDDRRRLAAEAYHATRSRMGLSGA